MGTAWASPAEERPAVDLANTVWEQGCTVDNLPGVAGLPVLRRVLRLEVCETPQDLQNWCAGLQIRARALLHPVCPWDRYPPEGWKALVRRASSLPPGASGQEVGSIRLELIRTLAVYIHSYFCGCHN